MSSPCALRLPPAVGTMTNFLSGPPASSMNFSLMPLPLRLPPPTISSVPFGGPYSGVSDAGSCCVARATSKAACGSDAATTRQTAATSRREPRTSLRIQLPHVFPVADLAFGYPLHGGFEALVARGVGLGLGHPRDVLALRRGAEAGERRVRLLVLLDRGQHVGRRLERFLRRLRLALYLDAGVVERRRLLDHLHQLRLRRRVVERLEAAELPHRVDAAVGGKRLHQRRLPERQRAVRLEGGHPDERSLVLEGRHAPLDRLGDLGARGVDSPADPLEDRAGEGLRLRDVRIDTWIVVRHPDSPG